VAVRIEQSASVAAVDGSAMYGVLSRGTPFNPAVVIDTQLAVSWAPLRMTPLISALLS
jgi:hypothetical protein